MTRLRYDVLVVGAGLAGLSCAVHLHRAGRRCLVLEAGRAVGGRVRTDEVEGFLLDRGFQVLLTAYPECRRFLDYRALDLRPFEPGCLIRLGGRFHRLADPWRRPSRIIASLRCPAGGLGDKLRVARLRRRLRGVSVDELMRRPERTTRTALREEGFGEAMISRFFRPFLGGVFLEDGLETSSRMFEFVFKMFAEGDTALPARGMGAIPEQLADVLPGGTVRTASRVSAVDEGVVHLVSGETLRAAAVVVATEGSEAARLVAGLPRPSSHATVCLYFDAPEPPIAGPLLVLDGESSGPVNHLCVPSLVAPTYAPPGRSLISASVVGDTNDDDDGLEAAARRQLTGWFGGAVDRWRRLRVYRIRHALPAQPPGTLEPPQRPVRRARGLYVCGDYLETGSLQGAMVAGRRAAQALLDDLP